MRKEQFLKHIPLPKIQWTLLARKASWCDSQMDKVSPSEKLSKAGLGESMAQEQRQKAATAVSIRKLWRMRILSTYPCAGPRIATVRLQTWKLVGYLPRCFIPRICVKWINVIKCSNLNFWVLAHKVETIQKWFYLLWNNNNCMFIASCHKGILSYYSN